MTRFLDARKTGYVRLMLKSVEVKFKYFRDLKWVAMSSFAKNIESLTFLFEQVLDKPSLRNYADSLRLEARFNFFQLQEHILRLFKSSYVENANYFESERQKQRILESLLRNDQRASRLRKGSVLRASLKGLSRSRNNLRGTSGNSQPTSPTSRASCRTGRSPPPPARPSPATPTSASPGPTRDSRRRPRPTTTRAGSCSKRASARPRRIWWGLAKSV